MVNPQVKIFLWAMYKPGPSEAPIALEFGMALAPLHELRPSPPTIEATHAPANIEAEQALLGILLYDNAAFERVTDHLHGRHFFEPFHGRLYEAIQSHVRRGQLAEPILLAEQFQRDPAFEDLGAYGTLPTWWTAHPRGKRTGLRAGDLRSGAEA